MPTCRWNVGRKCCFFKGKYNCRLYFRKNKNIVPSIFALYAPEISDGTISIDNVVRYPGIKTKLLVSTHDEEIDPAGSLIWQKWMRVKSVMEELAWEKIDIIVDNGNISAEGLYNHYNFNIFNNRFGTVTSIENTIKKIKE